MVLYQCQLMRTLVVVKEEWLEEEDLGVVALSNPYAMIFLRIQMERVMMSEDVVKENWIQRSFLAVHKIE